MRFPLLLLMLAAPPVLADVTALASGSPPLSFTASADESTYPAGSGDPEFAAVYDAFISGEAEDLALFSRRLKNSPLEVYASYYQLRLALDNAQTPASLNPEIIAFLSRPSDTPVIDLLRAEWLKKLGKNKQWDLFDAEFPHRVNESIELTCYALQSRSRSNFLLALRDVRALWFDGNTLPESCGTLFDQARSVGIIDQHDILQRLRLALELNNVTLASYLIEQLKEDTIGLSAELKKAAADPNSYLRNLSLANATANQRIIILFALQRVAKQNPELATSRWSRLSAHFPETEQLYFYGRLAYEAARNLDERALKWYRKAGNTPLNEAQLAWRVRAALRAQNWQEVLDGINAMRAQQQRDPAWRYWKARALKSLGKPIEARALFAPLSAEYHFYGQLAADELTDVLSEPQSLFKPSEYTITQVAARPGVKRTLALYRAGLRSEALEEWRWVLRDFNDRELLAAAEVAKRNEMYDRAIGAANKTLNLHDFSLRYLAPYRDAMQGHIRENELDEAWVYGLMRQESRFSHSAKSGVGAAGLMQIMPSTARWVASKLGLKNYRTALLHEFDTNLRLGTYYMKTVLTQSENSPVLASAAYNAGPLRALQWRSDRPLEGAIYAECIPYEETREYVKKVLSNTVYYADQFGEPPRSLKQRLGIVPAKETVKPQGVSDVP